MIKKNPMKKIISPKNGGITAAPTPPRAGLTMEAANQLGGALQRRAELSALTILTKETEAELRALGSFIAETITDNAAELLGCWFTVRREYEPLLKAFASVAFRVSGILSYPVAAAGPAEQQQTAPSTEAPTKEK
jgi:hypothetical protein